jgi:hypothetical protein
MFDSVKEYLDKGIGQKIIGFFVTLLITYGLIWQIIEPLIYSKQLFSDNALDWWWQIQLISTFIIGTAIFFFLLPQKVLQSIGFEVQDTKLNTGWNVHKGNPKLQISHDGYYSDVLYIQSNFDTDAIDTDVQANAQKANSVQYVFQPIKRFVFYLHLNVTSTTGGRPQDVWVPLRTDITKPIGDKNGIEIAYPANAKNAKNGWLVSKVNIHKVVKETFGHSEWKYLNLIGFRIKGEGKIQKIIIR